MDEGVGWLGELTSDLLGHLDRAPVVGWCWRVGRWVGGWVRGWVRAAIMSDQRASEGPSGHAGMDRCEGRCTTAHACQACAVQGLV